MKAERRTETNSDGLREAIVAAVSADSRAEAVERNGVSLLLPAMRPDDSILAAQEQLPFRCRIAAQSGKKVAGIGFLPWDFVFARRQTATPAGIRFFSLPAEFDALAHFVEECATPPVSAPPLAVTASELAELFAEFHRVCHSLVNILAPLRFTLEDTFSADQDTAAAARREWQENLGDTPQRPALGRRLGGIEARLAELSILLPEEVKPELEFLRGELRNCIAAVAAPCGHPPSNFLENLSGLINRYGEWFVNVEQGMERHG